MKKDLEPYHALDFFFFFFFTTSVVPERERHARASVSEAAGRCVSLGPGPTWHLPSASRVVRPEPSLNSREHRLRDRLCSLKKWGKELTC